MAQLDRRTLLTRTAAAVGLTVSGVGGYRVLHRPAARRSAAAGDRPNILVIVVDQLRAPQWFPPAQHLDSLLPNLARLRRAAVSFDAHYTASNMCTPSRGAMVTGLYSHQTGCLFTGEGPSESQLAPRFPTWGTLLRWHGYQTWWWGKWHLGHPGDSSPDGLDAHGFAGGTYPSPNGAPNQGLHQDPGIVDQFAGWFDAHAGTGPWCTTVSLVNPHDICWWPRSPLPDDVAHRFDAPPANFETPDALHRRGKPQLQIDYAQFMSPLMTGAVSYTGARAAAGWARCLDMYLWLQQQVDAQVGRVLDVLASRPAVDANTVVVFTSDHGEYGGSHGLRGKGAAIYEEAIRVPLYVRDPSGRLTPDPGGVRGGLTSSVDLTPLLLTIGTGGNGWRADPRYAYLVGRADLAAMAADPRAPGRSWIAHLTDDMSVEEMVTLLKSPQVRATLGITDPLGRIPTSAPSHIVAIRTPAAKLGVYSHWRAGTMTPDPDRPVEHEFYDYTTALGRQEIDNQAGRAGGQATLTELIEHEVLPEVHAPLPAFLDDAREQGLANMAELIRLRGE